jgi:hypothetical protein
MYINFIFQDLIFAKIISDKITTLLPFYIRLRKHLISMPFLYLLNVKVHKKGILFNFRNNSLNLNLNLSLKTYILSQL